MRLQLFIRKALDLLQGESGQSPMEYTLLLGLTIPFLGMFYWAFGDAVAHTHTAVSRMVSLPLP